VPVPVPVEAIAEDLLGLWVGEREDLGASGVLLPERREIWVDAGEARESPGRRRFTIAHEIGHWVCQVRRGLALPILCRSGDVSSSPAGTAREREANVFAADLLMPEADVRDATARGMPAAELAERLGVSEVALGWRLFNLGLIDERPSSGT
jgi:Zn-dependent peptidase ImmA (M78 family)